MQGRQLGVWGDWGQVKRNVQNEPEEEGKLSLNTKYKPSHPHHTNILRINGENVYKTVL